MIIRNAKKEDLDQWVNLAREDYEEISKIISEKTKAPSRNQFKKDFLKGISSKTNVILLAKEGSKSIAYLYGDFIIKPNVKKGYISDIFVTKEFRKKGVATILINHFIKLLKLRRMKKLELHVNNLNKNAIDLYNKLGFKIKNYQMVKNI